MSTDYYFEDDDDRPSSRPAGEQKATPRIAFDDDGPTRPVGFGFWLSVCWCLLYVVVSQIVVGVAAFAVVFGILGAMGRIGLDDLGPMGGQGGVMSSNARTGLLIVVALTQFGGLALSLLLLRLWCGKSWPRKIALTRKPSVTHLAIVAIAFPAMIGLSGVLEEGIKRTVPNLGEVMSAIGINYNTKGSTDAIADMVKFAPWGLAIFAIAVSPGICEEVFCRGFLAQGLAGRYSTWAVIGITSFLFGCIHLDPQQGLGAMLLAWWIHAVYIASRSLLLAMLVHFVNNGLAVIHFSDRLFPIMAPFEETFQRSPVLFTLASALLFGITIYAIWQTRCKLVSKIPGLEAWKPDSPASVELPPPGSNAIVTHDPISPVSAMLIVIGAVVFAMMMVTL